MTVLGTPPWTYDDGATHLGDGVYARRDDSRGIVLRTETMQFGESEIWLEPETMDRLLKWSGIAEQIRKKVQAEGPTAAQEQQIIQDLHREQPDG